MILWQAPGPSQGVPSQAAVSPSVAGTSSPAAASPSGQPALQATSSVRKSPGRNEQQLNYLLERQKEFKTAALQAKKQGDLEGAKNYLRMSKVRKDFIYWTHALLFLEISLWFSVIFDEYLKLFKWFEDSFCMADL